MASPLLWELLAIQLPFQEYGLGTQRKISAEIQGSLRKENRECIQLSRYQLSLSRSLAQAMLKLKQQLSSEAGHKKERPRSAPITPVLERLRQEDHRFEPSLGSITKSCIEEKGGG